jgi:hypothetical protein
VVYDYIVLVPIFPRQRVGNSLTSSRLGAVIQELPARWRHDGKRGPSVLRVVLYKAKNHACRGNYCWFLIVLV